VRLTVNPRFGVLRGRTLVSALTLVICMLAAAPALWASNVTMSVGSISGANGATVDVPVTLTGAPGIGALHVELVYDAAVLEPRRRWKPENSRRVVPSWTSTRPRGG
jgi:hypothetical protein